MGSYNKRAVLVRILYDHPKVGEKSRYLQPQSNRIQKVKYFTKQNCSSDVPCYNWKNDEFTDMEALYRFICHYMKTFELSDIPTTSECWNGIVSIIEQLEFKYVYEANKDELQQVWTSKPLTSNQELENNYNSMSEDQEDYITSLGTALECDMKSGQAKQWMNTLIETIIKSDDSLSLKNLRCLNPSSHCNTNTKVETVIDDLSNPLTKLLFDTPISCDSSTLSPNVSSVSMESLSSSELLSNDSNGIDRQTVVPDFCAVIKGFPGCFPIVADLKQAGHETQGYDQNRLKMLSKMFFQDFVFGLVVSPRAYQASVIIKNQGVLHFASSTHSFTTFKDGTSILDLKAMNDMCTFIYRVLKWCKKSKCTLNF